MFCSATNKHFLLRKYNGGIRGTVSDTKGETLVGASVTATHTRTGAQYATVSNIDGRYTLLNMAVGGPYTITVSYVGYTDQKSDNVYLSLGQTLRLDIMMQEKCPRVTNC